MRPYEIWTDYGKKGIATYEGEYLGTDFKDAVRNLRQSLPGVERDRVNLDTDPMTIDGYWVFPTKEEAQQSGY